MPIQKSEGRSQPIRHKLPTKADIADYILENSSELLSGQRLLNEDEGMSRWGISKRQLQDLRLGYNRSGNRLRFLRISHNQIRFLPQDVLEFERLKLIVAV